MKMVYLDGYGNMIDGNCSNPTAVEDGWKVKCDGDKNCLTCKHFKKKEEVVEDEI